MFVGGICNPLASGISCSCDLPTLAGRTKPYIAEAKDPLAFMVMAILRIVLHLITLQDYAIRFKTERMPALR